MEGNNFCCYNFGEFRLDAKRRSLSKNGEKVPLSARNFDLLLFMVENSGRILEHEELLDKVWAGTFVEQATLKKGISTLRQILGANAENEFIKTIPRRGYSFTTPVHTVAESDEKVLVRTIEQEIIVEEYEEISPDEPHQSDLPPQIAKVSANTREQPIPAQTKNFKRSRIVVLAGAVVVVVLLAFFGVKTFFSKVTETRFSAENVRISRITNNGKVLAGTAVSQDGSYLVYPTGDKNGIKLWLRHVSTGTAKELSTLGQGSYWSFAISPDNSYVYYIVNNTGEPQKSGLYKVPILGGESQKLAENVGGVTISPDGKKLLLTGTRNNSLSVFTLDPNGENEHIVKSFSGNHRIWDIIWAPDNQSIVCTLRKVIDEKNIYYVIEIETESGKENIILPEQEKVLFGAYWLPDKRSLIITEREPNAEIRQLWQYFPHSQEWRRITNDNNSYKTVSLPRDGKTIFSCQESRLSAIWISEGDLLEKSVTYKPTSANRNSFRQITDGIRDLDKVGWLATGRLFYSGIEDGKNLIFTSNADGTNPLQITNGDDGIRIFPGIANNGNNISFISSKVGGRQLWRVDQEGKNLTQVTKLPYSIYDGQILRDNTTIIYEAQIPGSTMLLYKLMPDGKSIQLTDTENGYWAVSPDETMFAAEIMDPNTRKFHIELRSMTDGKIIRTFNFSPYRQISFTPDGKYLTYDANRGDASQIMLQPIDGGEPLQLTDFQTDEIFGFNWSPDGKRLAIVRGKLLNDAVVIKTN